MSDRTWRDRLAGARMQVDQEFSQRIRRSDLTSQEWSLVMTAVEFDIVEEDDTARLVADTSKVKHVIPEFENLQRGMPYAGDQSSTGGVLDSIKELLGLKSRDEETLATAEELTAEYATRLQAKLEETGRWTEIRNAARSQPTDEE